MKLKSEEDKILLYNKNGKNTLNNSHICYITFEWEFYFQSPMCQLFCVAQWQSHFHDYV